PPQHAHPGRLVSRVRGRTIRRPRRQRHHRRWLRIAHWRPAPGGGSPQMKRAPFAWLIVLLPLRVLAQQNPDLGLTAGARDSVLAHYHQFFPIWGRKAVERGFDLPAALGFNVGGFYANQDIIITDLGLGFNNPPQPAGFIQFEKAEAKLTNVNLRT